MAITEVSSQPPTARKRLRSQAAPIIGNVVIIGLWLWLYRPVFDYLAFIFTRHDFRTNQLLLAGIILLIGSRIRKAGAHPTLLSPPHLYLPALSLAVAGSTLYLVVERFLDINTLSASLFGLATYGLLGLWLTPRPWRQGFPAILLLIGTLPFGQHMQTFVGYPMRILTAGLVRDGLAAAGVNSVGLDTILILENGVSQVDLPCSGVKSLWTGMLFLISATWIEQRRLNRRWFVTLLVFTALLFLANLARVAVLVVVGQVAGWRLAAEMLHVPLGVLGFVGCCAVAVTLLRRQSPTPQAGSTSDGNQTLTRPRWMAPGLVTVLLVMALLYAPRPQSGLSQPPPAWQFPAELVTEPMPLKPDEIVWLTRDGATSADRLRFEWQGITGSMILITSNTWRAHHQPERCFEVYGLSLEASRTHLVSPEFPVRLVSLGGEDEHSLMMAAYWFQSADHVTNDYATRMWADLPLERQRWVLVSILFDAVPDGRSADVQQLYASLHEAVSHSLQGGSDEA